MQSEPRTPLVERRSDAQTRAPPNSQPPSTMPLPEDQVLLLHNPRCSKSRATLALLEQHAIEFNQRDYLEHPLDLEELKQLHQALGRPVRQWVRAGEGAYAQAGLSQESGEQELLEALAANPILMERPIVLRAGQARVGRPPEAILELFESS